MERTMHSINSGEHPGFQAESIPSSFPGTLCLMNVQNLATPKLIIPAYSST